MAIRNEELRPHPVASGKPTLPLIPLVLTALVAVLGAVALCAGATFWLIRSGRIPLQTGPSRVEAAAKPVPVTTHFVALDPLLVNLADRDGHAYLRVSMTLMIEDRPAAKGESADKAPDAKGKMPNEFEAAERDVALSVLGRQTSDALLSDMGKEQLKQQLKAAFAEHIPGVKVQEILLTEFLVQR